ncbi:hypothetical protein Tco_1344008 [Tanacetum coccineum]
MVLRPLMEAQLLPWQMTTIPIGNTGGPREIPVSKKRKNYKIHKMATFLLQWYGRSSWPHSLFDAVWKSRYFSIDCAEEIKVTFCYGELHENIEDREILFLYCYAFSVSLLLTPLCCDDIHEVTPRVSALAGCDRLVSEPLVIEK